MIREGFDLILPEKHRAEHKEVKKGGRLLPSKRRGPTSNGFDDTQRGMAILAASLTRQVTEIQQMFKSIRDQDWERKFGSSGHFQI
jgi:hypothetical protein